MPQSNLDRTWRRLLCSFGEGAPSVEAKLDFVQGRRRNADESRELDRFLIGEVVTLRSGLRDAQKLLERLRGTHEELTEAIEKLRAPPLHQAIYLGAAHVLGRRLATVAHQGARHLVETEEESLLDNLEAGDQVLVTHNLGMILGKGQDRAAIGETATVERRLPGDRLVVRDRDLEVVLDTTEALRDEAPGPGDQVLWSREIHLAFGKVATSESSPHLVDIEEITEAPTRLGGLAQQLRRLLSLFTICFTEPDLARRFGLDEYNHSVLLEGPSGCGKTLMARTIAYEITQRAGAPCRFAVVNGAELSSPWVGETERNIRQLFRTLTDLGAPAVLFLDEVEAIGRHRGHFSGHHSDRFLSQWLTCLDGFRKRGNIAVVAASNRKDLVDPALLQRLSGLEIAVGRPSRDGAGEIFRIHLPEHLPFGANGTAPQETRRAAIDSAVSRLYDPNADNEVATLRFRDGARRTIAARELVSGRLIAQICRAAQHRALARAAEWRATDGDRELTAGEGITVEDMGEAVADAIEKLTTTLSVQNAHHYLTDLSADADVVSVEPVRRRVRRHRYLVAS